MTQFDQSGWKTVWDSFARAGITDPHTVLEHIAAVMVDRRDMDDAPRVPEESLRQRILLQIASLSSQERASLLNRYLPFYPGAKYRRGEFPTPRHLADLMVSLVRVRSGNTVADLACGTGGLLVAAAQRGAAVKGVDVNVSATRVARASLTLLRKQPSLLRGVNALDVTASDLAADVMLLAPAFGAKTVNPDQTDELLGFPTARSEAALIGLALKHLSHGGSAALLVPQSLLSGGDRVDERLRTSLLTNHDLEAVITLPPHALQPFSGTQTYLTVLRKGRRPAEPYTWFVRLTSDGYVASRSRNLTADPDAANNDYLLLERLLSFEESAAEHSDVNLHMWPLSVPGRPGRAAVLRPRSGFRIAALERVEHDAGTQLVATLSNATGVASFVLVSPDAPPAVLSEARRAEQTVAAQLMFQDGGMDEAVAVLYDGQVFAVYRKLQPFRDVLERGEDVNLLPESMLSVPTVSEASRQSPAVLLTSLREKQRTLSSNIERLFSLLQAPAAVTEPEPVLLSELDRAQFPIGSATNEQLNVWESICDLEQAAREVGRGIRFFTVEDVRRRAEIAAWIAQTTLDLLCRMGLVVAVTDRGLAGYRLATTLDVWKTSDGGTTEEASNAT